MMTSTFSTVKPKLRFFKFPKLSGPKKLALILGFIVWFLLGFLLKTRYGGLDAFGIGFGMAYGPMLSWDLFLRLVIWLDKRGSHVAIGLAAVMGVAGIFVGGGHEMAFFTELLGSVGFSYWQQAMIGITYILVSWIAMPLLWSADIFQNPMASA